jgi:hypothetical protein
MDSTALHELIAEVRATTAALAEAEQRVASVTAELAQQDPPNPLSRFGGPLQSVETQDGWRPAERPCPPRLFCMGVLLRCKSPRIHWFRTVSRRPMPFQFGFAGS